jgi:hypothetical protein
MSKKFNVKDIVDARKNELDHSPLFQSKPASVASDKSLPTENVMKTLHQNQQNTSIPETQNAGITVNQQAGIPETQHASKLAIQQNTTATEKVTYRFHPEGKYAIEDIKTILSRRVGIKASYELIAEEAILIAYEDLLENQHASKLAKRLSRKPENKKSS